MKNYNYKYKYVISKTPYRISLGGGGTDLPFYSYKKGGDLITAAIDQYCFVSLGIRKTDTDVLVQTTDIERKKNVNDINHNIIRECLKYFSIKDSIQISTFSTIPSKTGLGSSSTLTVGLVNSISTLLGLKLSKNEIAHISWEIERDILKQSGGIQDQYISSFGGIKRIKVNKHGKVSVKPFNIKQNSKQRLKKGLILVYAGSHRDSTKVIKEISNKKKYDNVKIFDEIKNIGIKSHPFLSNGNISKLGKLMDDHWKFKKKLSDSVSNNQINKTYGKLKKFGSTGGKIIGAGGGGFFLMAVPKNNLINFKLNLKKNNLNILDWNFDETGSQIIEMN